ncbi:MAG: TIGR00153 family protein [Nitrospinae bacterium]|nr:TIGR00153 family protein [Nitrospinota bacterium]|tara:strand:- start:944 stop:1618 length:675 start_codon:yes stop_codon:yes gene_type:complete
MRAIVQLFTKSPFGALQEHMVASGECVDRVRSMFEALLAGDHEELASIAKDISKIEHRADEIKNEIRDSLPRSIFLPVDRADLLSVLSQQDSIPDTVEDIAFLLTVRRTFVPPSWEDPLIAYVDRCVGTFRSTFEVMDSLEGLLEVGLAGPEADEVLEKIDTVGQLEWKADKAQFDMLRLMFDMEDDLKPVDLFWWSKILREVGDIANYSEKTVDRIRLMLYKK